MHGCPIAGRHPEPLALPPGRRIIDAAVDSLGEEAHRIRNAQLDDLPKRQRVQRIREVAGADGRVRAQAEDVVLVHPRVVGALGRTVSADKRGPGQRVERPALGAQIAFRCSRPAEAPLALASVEAGDVAARQRHPRHALAVDIEPAHSVSGRRNLVDFRQRGLLGIRSRLYADYPPGVADVRPPDGTVRRAVRDAVEAEPDPLVLGGIFRLVGLDVRVSPAVAVGVDDERCPAL